MKSKILILISLLLIITAALSSCGGSTGTGGGGTENENENRPPVTEDKEIVNGIVTYYAGEYDNGRGYGASVRGSAGALTIPATINGFPVMSVEVDSDSEIGALTIENGIESVWLSSSARIEKLIIPRSVRGLTGEGFLYGIGELELDPSSTSFKQVGGIIYNADMTEFVSVPNKLESNLVIPDSISYIYPIDSKEVRSLDTGDGLTSLPEGEYKQLLKKLHIGASVEINPIDLLCEFANLEEITVSEDHPRFTVIDGVLCDKNSGETLFTPPMVNPYEGDENAYIAEDGVVYLKQTIHTIYNEEYETYTAVDYFGDGGEITIPATVNGLPVDSISQSAFLNKVTITKAIVEAEITEIPFEAFAGCSSLSEIKLPDSLRRIEATAFRGCDFPTVGGVIYADSWIIGWDLSETQEIAIREGTVGIFDGNGSYFKNGGRVTHVPASLIYFPRSFSFTYNVDAFETVKEDGGVYIGGVLVATYDDPNAGSTLKIKDGTVSFCARLEGSGYSYLIVPGTVKYFNEESLYNGSGRVNIEYKGTAEQWFNLEKTTYSSTGYSIALPDSWWRGGHPIIEDGVTEIKNNPFLYCGELYSITLPSSVKRIGVGVSPSSIYYGGSLVEFTEIEWASEPYNDFRLYIADEQVTEINIPSEMTSLGILGKVIDVSFTVADSHPTLYSVSGVIYDRENHSIIHVPHYIDGELIIPEGVTSVGYSFSNVLGVTSLSIPSTLTDFYDSNLFECDNITEITVASGNTNLFVESGILYSRENMEAILAVDYLPDEIVIPEGVTRLPSALWGKSFVSLSIPSTLTEMDDGILQSCNSLESITLAAGNESFTVSSGILYSLANGSICFAPAELPREIVIPEGITELTDTSVFANSLITSVSLPSTLVSLNSDVFGGCTALTSVTVANENPVYLSQNGVLYSLHNGGEIAICLVPEALSGDIEIPEGVTNIANCFSGKRITSVSIPETVAELVSGAFSGCSELTKVSFSDSLIMDPISVFEGCVSLEYEEYGNVYYLGNYFIRPVSLDIVWARIKDGVSAIPEYAFEGCSRLGRVYVPDSVTSVGKYAFRNTNYQYFGCYFESFSTIDFAINSQIANTAGDVYYRFNEMLNGVSIDENGIAYSYAANTKYTGVGTPVMSVVAHFSDAEEITVPATIEGHDVFMIFPNAFMDNNTAKKVTVEKCTAISFAAFWGCTALTEIILPDALQTIGNVAFWNCTSLKSVKLGRGLIMIGKMAFQGCTALESITCPDRLNAWTDSGSIYATFPENTNFYPYVEEQHTDHYIFSSIMGKEEVELYIRKLNAAT